MASLPVDELRSAMKGAVLCPGDPGYDAARTVWNAMIDRRPAAIARCVGNDDVRRAVGFGRKHGLALAVRGGGHNIAGSAVCDDGLVIDLSQMKSVMVDPKTCRASVEPGATLREFDHEAQAFGLATPLGINSTTGVAGLTLGGGFGWLTRKHGMTVDNLLAADVVTADGRLVRASQDDHSDLFWALRGGGGNFGVVTRFEFTLHPVGPEVLAGLIVFPGTQARAVLDRYRAFTAAAPDELAVWAVMRKAPPLPFLPAEAHGTDILALAVCYAGDMEKGTRQIEPIRGFGRPLGEHLGPVPYEAWQQAFDPLLTPGARNYWKSHNFAELPDGLLDAATAGARRAPSPHCEVFIGHLDGRAGRIPRESTAYPHRDARYVMNLHGRWETPDEDERGTAWTRDVFTACAPFATGGVYVNFMTEEETDRVAAAYGSHHARLVEVKNKFDPDNVFRLNQNIRPSVSQPVGAGGSRR